MKSSLSKKDVAIAIVSLLALVGSIILSRSLRELRIPWWAILGLLVLNFFLWIRIYRQ
jgi:hypothetical protein